MVITAETSFTNVRIMFWKELELIVRLKTVLPILNVG